MKTDQLITLLHIPPLYTPVQHTVLPNLRVEQATPKVSKLLQFPTVQHCFDAYALF